MDCTNSPDSNSNDDTDISDDHSSFDIFNNSSNVLSTTGTNWSRNNTILAGGNYYGNANYTITNSATSQHGLSVTGDTEFKGSVKINGISISDTIEKINQRLTILVPDPAKLEHFESLKKAYEHYKMLENLCQLPVSKSDK